MQAPAVLHRYGYARLSTIIFWHEHGVWNKLGRHLAVHVVRGASTKTSHPTFSQTHPAHFVHPAAKLKQAS